MKTSLYALIVAFICSLTVSFTQAKQSVPTVIFSHGIKDSFTQAFWYAKNYSLDGIIHYNDRYLFSSPFVTFNYPDASNNFLHANYGETSLGQDNEIDRLHAVYTKTIARSTDIILIGLSRGASALFTFVGKHQPDNLRALVAESPYDNPKTIVHCKMQQSGLGWIPSSWGDAFAELCFRKYKRNGINPYDSLSSIPLDLPILIICSREDSIVPHTSSLKLYKKLRELGHKHVYIFIADHGKHAKILSGLDGEKYQAITHAFFKRYNLPHDAAIAEKGTVWFAQCQPGF